MSSFRGRANLSANNKADKPSTTVRYDHIDLE